MDVALQDIEHNLSHKCACSFSTEESVLVNFREELESCKGEKSLVLGNGFGISYDFAAGTNSFCWDSLADLCEFEVGSPLMGLLEECNFDFEIVHQKINNAIAVIKKYDDENHLSENLAGEIQVLRDQLISAVALSHPPSLNRECSPDEKRTISRMVSNCRSFLTKFEKVFSLNYDLLLYWVRCFDNDYLGNDCFEKHDDELIFSPNDNAEFLFPHGALFIYRDGYSAKKSRSSKHRPILAQVKENIEKGIFPMCVSEGKGNQKLSAIKSNEYLSFCYGKIKECKGTVFTYGASFSEGKDSHIIEALIKSPATRIIVGDFKPSEGDKYRLLHEFNKAMETLNEQKEVVVADTSSIDIW